MNPTELTSPDDIAPSQSQPQEENVDEPAGANVDSGSPEKAAEAEAVLSLMREHHSQTLRHMNILRIVLLLAFLAGTFAFSLFLLIHALGGGHPVRQLH